MTTHATGNTRGMAGGAARPARGREGADPAQRRARAAAPGAALGPDRQGLSVRHRRRAAPRWPISFRGRSQLLVYHFMFGPDYKAGCPSCSTIADGFNGFAVHLANHDVMLWAVSRAPLAKLQAFKQRMGWTFPWASSAGERLQLRLQRLVHRGAAARGRRRIQLPARRRRPMTTQTPTPVSQPRGHAGTDTATFLREQARHERLRARGRRRLPHLFDLCPRTGWPLGHVPMARPRAQGSQRDGPVVAPPRPLRRAGGQGVSPAHSVDARPADLTRPDRKVGPCSGPTARGRAIMSGIPLGRCDGGAHRDQSDDVAALGFADWLHLAATPTFLAMALSTGVLAAARRTWPAWPCRMHRRSAA